MAANAPPIRPAGPHVSCRAGCGRAGGGKNERFERASRPLATLRNKHHSAIDDALATWGRFTEAAIRWCIGSL